MESIKTEADMKETEADFKSNTVINDCALLNFVKEESRCAPLSKLEKNTRASIARLDTSPEMKHRLESLGLVPGARVTMVSNQFGNCIIEVLNSRVALDCDIASKIQTISGGNE